MMVATTATPKSVCTAMAPCALGRSWSSCAVLSSGNGAVDSFLGRVRFSRQCAKRATRNAAMASPRNCLLLQQEEDQLFRKTKDLPFYVSLPSDTVTNFSTINRCRAIQAGLRALRALGVDGVVVHMYWGIIESCVPQNYNWSAYCALLDMIQGTGLKVFVSICFHADPAASVGLPTWVSRLGYQNPDIFFTDQQGTRYKHCLSLAVDNLPLFQGRTFLQIYSHLLQSFKSTFDQHLGDSILGLIVSLGPDGELKYPAFRDGIWKFPGVGEFQCYDKYMLANLRRHSEIMGCPEWGLEGPPDAPAGYNQCPNDVGFFHEDLGSWDTAYGDFFLTWYSNQLLNHGDDILSMCRDIFKDYDIVMAGKLPAIHWWYRTKSHAAELTAGYYNVQGRDGYDEVMEMFARNSCLPILANLEASELDYPIEAMSSPESLLLQIRRSSLKHRVSLAGENSHTDSTRCFERMIHNVHLTYSSEMPSLASFTFRSMSQSLFSPDRWRFFVNFFRNIKQYDMEANQRRMLSKDSEIDFYKYVRKHFAGA